LALGIFELISGDIILIHFTAHISNIYGPLGIPTPLRVPYVIRLRNNIENSLPMSYYSQLTLLENDQLRIYSDLSGAIKCLTERAINLCSNRPVISEGELFTYMLNKFIPECKMLMLKPQHVQDYGIMGTDGHPLTNKERAKILATVFRQNWKNLPEYLQWREHIVEKKNALSELYAAITTTQQLIGEGVNLDRFVKTMSEPTSLEPIEFDSPITHGLIMICEVKKVELTVTLSKEEDTSIGFYTDVHEGRTSGVYFADGLGVLGTVVCKDIARSQVFIRNRCHPRAREALIYFFTNFFKYKNLLECPGATQFSTRMFRALTSC
jgi:hypothetical protein